MDILSRQFAEAAKRYGRATILRAEEAKELRITIDKIYSNPGASPLWERMIEHVAVHDPDGWKRLEVFIRRFNDVVIFFDQHEDSQMVDVGSDIVVPALGDCSGFEFYITTLDCGFILCFNHHDMLIGAGQAREWLEQVYE